MQHRTAAWRCVVSLSLFRIVKKNASSSSKYRRFWWDPRARSVHNKKWIRPTSTVAPYTFPFKSEVFPTWAPLQNPKQMKARLSKVFFKLQLQNCVFPIFTFYLLSPISALLLPTSSTSSFQKLVEKVQNYIKEVWLILKKWVWCVDFECFFLSCLTRKMS